MIKILLAACLTVLALSVDAQWSTAGTHIYNTNSGGVGIGTLSPLGLLQVGAKSIGYGSIVMNDAGNSTALASIDLYGGYTKWATFSSDNLTGKVVVGNMQAYPFSLQTNGTDRLYIDAEGKIGIGVSLPSEKLSVAGNVAVNGVISTRKIIVKQVGWSDYVFQKGYKLKSISSLEKFINENGHLPDVPSAKEVEEKGISVGDNQALLLKKIEELTLYIIQQQKEIEALKKRK